MQFIEIIFENSKLMALIIIIGFILHGTLGKPRWQYYPIYLLGILYSSLISLNYFKLLELDISIIKWILAIGIVLIFSSIIFSLVFPIEKLPKPSGKFGIGTIIYDLEDKSRNEIYNDTENQKRKIKYQIWYPAKKTNKFKRVKWINDGVLLTRHLARSMYIPAFILDHTAKIDSNSYYKPPVNNALDNYPVVIISHGWKGFRELHTDYAEELASNGFIAISIDHTYGSQFVRFKDGEIAYLNKYALPRVKGSNKYNSRLLVTTYGEDVESVLDDLEKLNSTDKYFKGKLNLEKVGLLGHSTGGGGDVYVSLEDKRIKALLGLDAWIHPIKSKTLGQGLPIPMLFLSSEQWIKEPNNDVLISLVRNSKDAALIEMYHTNHVDFSMLYMYSPITKYIGFTGKLGGRHSSKIQREFILNFFDKSLRNDSKYNKNYLVEIVEKYDNLKLVDID